MDRLPSLSIVVPSYNEASNVRQTVLEAHGLLRAAIDTPCEWLLVDDGSTDGTWDEITALSQLVPNVVPIRHSRNVGLGAAVWSGMQRASSEWRVWIPADGQISSAAVVEMIQAVENAEAVFLMRREEYRSLSRRILTSGFHTLVRCCLRVNIRGFSGVYLVRGSIIERLNRVGVTAAQNLAVPLYCNKHGISSRFVFTSILERRSGQSKVANLRSALKSLWELLLLRWSM